MKITRRFTKPGVDVFSTVEWTKRTSRITNADGSIVFEMKDAEVPKSWSQLATDIMVSKYFRKAGVPDSPLPPGEGSGERASTGTEGDSNSPSPQPSPRGRGSTTGPETSARQVIHRLAGCWREWGEKHGYFDSREDAAAFYDELCHMMLHQMCAPNSPQWFNTGLNYAYGITGPAQGHWIADPRTGEPGLADDAYTHPQPHACFIQSIKDDLVGEGGIMDLWTREARLFKYGSGTGTNFSSLRGENEPLSGGGKSSGLMSFLKIGDRAAGAIKSGGTTRRAAKMVCLDADHPDIEDFVNWKVREELKVAALVEGMKHLTSNQKELAESLGLKLNYDFNGEAYYTVSGQNSNNSVRLTDAFFRAVREDGDWHLYRRTDGGVAKTIKARDLWSQICRAAWHCADPGVQYDTTINAWHTCPAHGRINASNPCVTGDTFVATSTGFRRIVDLVGQSAEIVNGDGNRVFVDRIFKTGTKPVFELKTKSGYRLRLTGDHKVRTANRGDVPACALTKDDRVVLEQPGFGDAFVPEAFGELVGAAIGDGCLTRGIDQEFLFITVGESEREVAAQLQANLVECKNWLDTGDRRGLRETEVTTTRTGLRVGTSVRALLDQFKRIAILDAGSERKRFTDYVHALDKHSIAAILRGLFTADGTVANYGGKSHYISLDSTSLELLQQVQLLLLGFGIKARIFENRRALGQDLAVLPDGKGGTKEYKVKQVHSLRITRHDRNIFEAEIGFMASSVKCQQLETLNKEVGTYKHLRHDEVESVTPCGIEDVFDLTEPISHHFVANGIVVHNCSEYMFLDNTACNLASLNLMKFYDSERRVFDVDAYEHGIELWTIVLEISVLMAAFPSKEIAVQSWKYRTLGLGYANLGAMLMQAGIPYDSVEGRNICGALTAILTGRAYATSARMAKELKPFAGFKDNRNDMLRVIRNHRRAAHGIPRDSDAYEDLSIKPVPIDHELFLQGSIKLANAEDILQRATNSWDEALEFGEQYGYRNAQVTVIAPTGTIGLLMDCDTTGVEPDFALVKFKKLAGGGHFKIANASLKPALKALRYSADEIDEIVTYVMGRLSLDVPMPGSGTNTQGGESPRSDGGGSDVTFREYLIKKGFEGEDIIAIENTLPTVFEIGFAFTAWSMPDRIMQQHGVNPDEAKNDPKFNGLKMLGLTSSQIDELNRVICGTQTVEGAPHLRDEHLPVFDCANKCGKIGTRFIKTDGHIRMMAASQPFITGAISKTINLPNEATEKDIADAYWLSWELGLKANALYRDGSKLSQPLNVKSDSDDDEEDEDEDGLERALGEVSTEVAEVASAISTSSPSCEATDSSGESEDAGVNREPEYIERVVEKIIERPMRRRLPDTRRSITHHFNVAGHEGYLTVGMYDNGQPGELFITMSKEGSTIGGLMDSLGTAISVALQYGVPIESLVNKFAHQRFEPMGMTTNKDVPFAKSLVDYIFRWMGMEFIAGYREANAPPRPGMTERKSDDSPKQEAGERGRIGTARAATSVKEDNEWSRPRPAQGTGDGNRAAIEPTNRLRTGNAAPAKIVDPPAQATSRISTLKRSSTQISLQDARDGSSRMTVESSSMSATTISALDRANAAAQSDAPACDNCGAITVRSGTCYKCLNCGNSMGCS